jgi:hypothetical protein
VEEEEEEEEEGEGEEEEGEEEETGLSFPPNPPPRGLGWDLTGRAHSPTQDRRVSKWRNMP